MARQFSTGAKFGSEKGKVQKPARIPPQTSLLAGGKKAVSKLVFKIVVNKSSNINQKTPPVKKARVCTGDWRKLAPPSFARLKLKRALSLLFRGRRGSQRAEHCKAAAIVRPDLDCSIGFWLAPAKRVCGAYAARAARRSPAATILRKSVNQI